MGWRTRVASLLKGINNQLTFPLSCCPAQFLSQLIKWPQSISGWIVCTYPTGSTPEIIHPQLFRYPLVQQDGTKIKHNQLAASYDPLFCGSLTSNSRYEWVFDPTQAIRIPHCKGASRERLIVSGLGRRGRPQLSWRNHVVGNSPTLGKGVSRLCSQTHVMFATMSSHGFI